MEFIEDEKKMGYYVDKFNLRNFFRGDYFSQYQNYMTIARFSKGEYLYRQKENIQYLYFFVEGKIKVSSVLSNGKRQALYYYKKFGILGDLELFNRSNPYTIIQAEKDSYCIALSLAYTKHLLYNDPVFLRNMAELLAEKLYHSSSNFSLNIYCSLENRLCAYLISSAEKKRDEAGTEMLVFQEKLSETAEILGTSYRHLHRTLKDLKEKELIEKCSNGYRIINLEALKQLSSEQFI